MAKQVFLLDSASSKYSTALGALASYDAANYNFTPTQTVRDAAHSTSLKVVFAEITEAELNGDSALADLRSSVYPTSLCRHRWTTLENFRALGGFHMIGESVRSYERTSTGGTMSTRTMLFIRPQQGEGATPGLGDGQDYGAGTGYTHYDALNGPQDPEIDKSTLGDAVWNKGYSYVWCDGAHVRWGDRSNGGNPDQSNGLANQGLIEVQDASSANNDKIYVYCDWDLMPGIVLGGYNQFHHASSLPWEEYSSGIYVHGDFNDGFGNALYQGNTALDADVDDLTVDITLLTKRQHLRGSTTLTTLESTSGRGYFYSQDNDGGTPSTWSGGVHVWNASSSSFTDITTPVNNSSANDFEILSTGAANGSYIAFIEPEPFSVVRLDLAQTQSGGTGQWEYYDGSSWSTFSNVADESSAFTAGTNTYDINFNPKSNWAKTSVNGSTGYAVRWRKTGGTVTQAARGDQGWVRKGAIFIRRWNDAKPTRGPCHFGTGGSGHLGGLRLELTDKGNVEFVRMRSLSAAQWGQLSNATPLVFTGCQFGLQGEMRTVDSGTINHTFKDATYGNKYWSSTDHYRPTSTHPGIVRLKNLISQAIANGETTTPDGREIESSAFDNIENWCDFFGAGAGIYASGGTTWNYTVDGAKWRFIGSIIKGLDGNELFDLETSDKHAIAVYGSIDGDNSVFRKIGIEDHTAAIDFYPQARGEYDAPVYGGGASCKNVKFSYGYNDTWNEKIDTGQPAAGIRFEQDNDTMRYETGDGGNTNNSVWFWEVDDTAHGSSSPVTGYTTTFHYVHESSASPVRIRYVSMNGLGQGFGAGANWGPASINMMTFDGSTTYSLETQYVKANGGIWDAIKVWSSSGYTTPGSSVTQRLSTDTWNPSPDFETISTGMPDNAYVAFIHNRQWGEFRIDIDVPRIGGAGQWEYSQGSSSWSTLAVSDNSSGFTNSGSHTLTFTIPGDWATDTLEGSTGYILRWRKSSGTVTQAADLHYSQVKPEIPIFPTGSSGEAVYFGLNTQPTWRIYVDTRTPSSGSPNLAWEYYDGSSWSTVSNLTDNTNGFTSTGRHTVTFERSSDFSKSTVNGLAKYWLRCRISSGSFSQTPITNDVAGIIYGASIDAQHYEVRNVGSSSKVAYYYGGNWGSDNGSIIDDNGTIYFTSTQNSTRPLYRLVSGGAPNLNSSEWQSQTKTIQNSDAAVDSVFGPNNTYTTST